MQTPVQTILALDVGTRRIGVAIADEQSRLPRPFTTLDIATALNDVEQIVKQQVVGTIIVGLPRNLSGDNTEQTRFTLDFIRHLKAVVNVPIYLQDEAVTSKKAEKELQARGKPYERGDIDSLAATYILDDYLRSDVGVNRV